MSDTNQKKSFVLYRNMRRHMAQLSREQQGALLMAIMDYADSAADGQTDMAAVLTQYPDMAPETRMAFFFIADVIRMDTEKWYQKQKNYQRAAQKRQEEKQSAASVTESELAKYVQNLPISHRNP